METNIVEILKDKPKGIKLSSPIFGKCEFNTIYKNTYKGGTGTIEVKVNNSEEYFDETGKYYRSGSISHDGKPLLFPSEEMRDWSKFAWKKGDILVSEKDYKSHIIFDKFNDDTYTTFTGKCYFKATRLGFNYIPICNTVPTEDFDKEKNDIDKTYTNIIGKKLGGKLNLETLEIENTQPEFKDGDILCVIDNFDKYHYILIYKGQDANYIYRYVAMFEDNSLNMKKDSYLTKPKGYSMRLATEEEKQQLFDALAEEGKAWDAEKKQIIDLKPKVELKPFDKVVVRCSEADRWSIDFFSYKVSNGYICTGDAWFKYCLPYNEETAKLIGTTNNAK